MSALARIAVPDLVTNSYFPALAGEELGFYRAEGLDGRVELLAPAPRAMAALRDGEVDFVVTGAHTTLTGLSGLRWGKAGSNGGPGDAVAAGAAR
jgi:ABC-type nitrate/sulfonate/bicarbonate transport system substrate-binding protein